MKEHILRGDISDIYDSVKDYIDKHYAIVYNQMPGDCYKHLEEMLKNVDESFAVALLGYIDAKGLSDPEVYRRAHMERACSCV